MSDIDIIKECRQTGRTEYTTKKLLEKGFYEQMTFNNEIEKTKKEIEVLLAKLSFLEELSQTKTPCEEAYKRVYGKYPEEPYGCVYDSTWKDFRNGYKSAAQDYNVGEYQEPKENEWKNVALRFGEKLVSISPCGYYEYTPEGWYEWVVNTYEKLADDWLSLLKKEKIKKEKVEKSKINDLAERLLPDDHPYKIADEHGETNPYKQYLNSVEDEKKMKELGFVKNAEGYWTARPLAQEEVKKLQEKEWNIKVVTDYLTGKSRHKLNIVDKDGNDYKPEPITTEELLKPNWEPKPQNENEVAEGLKSAFREAVKQGVVSSVNKPTDDFMDKMVSELKGKTLTDIVTRWWCDTFTGPHEKWSMEECIDDLIDQVELFLPKEQSANSQNTYVELTVEGYNDCIRQIKSKLR